MRTRHHHRRLLEPVQALALPSCSPDAGGGAVAALRIPPVAHEDLNAFLSVVDDAKNVQRAAAQAVSVESARREVTHGRTHATTAARMCARGRGGMFSAACCLLHGAQRSLQAALLRLDLRLEAEQREALKLKLSERKRQLTVRLSALPCSTPPYAFSSSAETSIAPHVA